MSVKVNVGCHAFNHLKMLQKLKRDIEHAIGQTPLQITSLTGGCIGQVYYLRTEKAELVAKVDNTPQARLNLESYMLRYLAGFSRLPVPGVLYSSDSLLVIEFVPGDSLFSGQAEVHAAELLAGLHAVRADAFGLEQDTLIGSLHQPNTWATSWVDFFRDRRLLYMGNEAVRAGRLPQDLYRRVERLGERLDRWLDEPEHPSLLHGDVWSGNVLAQNDRITAFLDPAIYYGHPEIELAFITLFTTFERPFFERYNNLRPLPPGFMEERRDIYNLYPLLVHARLFGGGYVQSVERIVRRFGF